MPRKWIIASAEFVKVILLYYSKIFVPFNSASSWLLMVIYPVSNANNKADIVIIDPIHGLSKGSITASKQIDDINALNTLDICSLIITMLFVNYSAPIKYFNIEDTVRLIKMYKVNNLCPVIDGLSGLIIMTIMHGLFV